MKVGLCRSGCVGRVVRSGCVGRVVVLNLFNNKLGLSCAKLRIQLSLLLAINIIWRIFTIVPGLKANLV